MAPRILRILLASACIVPVAASEESLLAAAKAVYAELDSDSPAARELYEKALALDPESFPLTQKTSQWQLEDGDLPAAAATRRNYAQRHPHHLAAQLDYVSFLLTQAPKDDVALSEAQQTLERADGHFPHNAAVFSRLISVYENRALRQKSLQLFAAKLAAEQQDSSYWLALAPIAKTLFPADDPQYQANLAHIFSQISDRELSSPALARQVSEHYRKQGDLPTAIAKLTHHLQLNPSSHSLRTRLGLLELSAGEDAAGKATLLQVLAIDPDQELAHRSLARLYREQGAPDKALYHRAEGIRITGGNPGEAVEVAKAYLTLDDPHSARLLLEKARFHHPDELAILAQLAIATLRDGLTVEASRLFRQAEQLAKSSPDPDAQSTLDADFQIEFAQMLAAAGDFASAETRLRQTAQSLNLDEEPLKYAQAVTALAKLWIDQDKNHAPAQALLQRALALDPDNATAASLLRE